MLAHQPLTAPPWIVYGTDCSYFTGKLEASLRAKGIPYRLEPFSEANLKHCARHTGVVQVPQVELPDGTWLVDTSLIIDLVERTHPEPMLHSTQPALRFLSLLLEDFADEWLWRPAMHYRWSFPANAELMGSWLSEHVAERWGPEWLKRLYWKQRQYRTFVQGDGVNATTRAAVEAAYLDTLEALEAVFAQRPYLLGDRPCEADFGFFGPMFRHFCCDPAPGRIMRTRAPRVHEWVARMWNTTPDRLRDAAALVAIPDDLGALWKMVTETYVVYLRANSEAYARDERQVRYRVQGVTFEEPTKPYRVWCRDQLHQRLIDLGDADRALVASALGSPAAMHDLTTASTRAVANPIGVLPLRGERAAKPVDSWWR